MNKTGLIILFPTTKIFEPPRKIFTCEVKSLNEAPQGLISISGCQPLGYTRICGKDTAAIQEARGVVSLLDRQQTVEVVLAPDLAREAVRCHVIRVVVDGRVVQVVLEVTEVRHQHLVTLVDEGLVGVVGPLGRREGDVRARGVGPGCVTVTGGQVPVEPGV